MKVKGSKSINLSIMLPVFFALSLILTVARSLQTAKFIDPATGFFTGGTVLNAVVYALAAVGFLFFAAVSFFSKDSEKVEICSLKNKSAGLFTALFGVTLIYDCFNSLVDCLTATSFSSSAVSEFSAMMTSGVLPLLMQSFFAIISAVFIFILAKDFLKGTSNASKRRLLALSPIAWAGFKLISRFIKKISYVNVSDLLFEMFLYSFMLLFFLALSQVITGVYSDEGRWKLIAYGLTGGMLAVMISIPRLVFTLTGGAFVNAEYPFNIADFDFAFFAVFVAKAVINKINSEKSLPLTQAEKGEDN